MRCSDCFMPNISSFDVFDTCLTRKVASPIDVFRLMAPDVALLAGMDYSEQWGEEFVRVRINAEHDTRKKSLGGETNLECIWREICRVLGFHAHQFAQIELNWEEMLCQPVARTHEMVLMAREKGDQILFVSDMYLPGVFIKKLLVKNDFLKDGDKVYVSCEIGASKSSGKMYLHIQEELKCKFNQIKHFGDNFFSDIQAAKDAGCHAEHIPDAKLNVHEEHLRQAAELPAHVATRLVGAIKVSRISAKSSLNSLATHFAAPFLFTFVNWVLEQAKTDGVEKLYFLGRDCQLAHKVACHPVLSQKNIECRYLHASRRAYMLASVKEISPLGIPWLDRRYDEKEVARILDKLELLPSDFEAEWRTVTGCRNIPKLIVDNKDWNSLWETLRSKNISSVILENGKQKKLKLQQYLIQEGIFEKKKVGFVDLGWKFSIQHSAQIILEELRPDFHLLGYYLGASVEHCNEVTARKLFMPMHREDMGSYFSCSFFPDKSIFLEHVIGRATHSTLVDFDTQGGKIIPITTPSETETQIREAEAFHADTLKALDYYQNLDYYLGNEQHARAFIKKLIELAHNNPSMEMALGVVGLKGGFDAYGKCEKTFVAPYTWNEFIQALISQNLSESHREWKEGSFVITPRLIRGLARRLNIVNRLLSY